MTTPEATTDQPEVVGATIEPFAGGFDPLRDLLEASAPVEPMDEKRLRERAVEIVRASALVLDRFGQEENMGDSGLTPWVSYGSEDKGFLQVRLSGATSALPETARYCIIEVREDDEDSVPGRFATVSSDLPDAVQINGKGAKEVGSKDFNYVRGLIRRIDAALPKPKDS